MRKTCPSCGTAIPFPPIRGIRIGPSAKSGVRWYRYAPPQITCRTCGAELRSTVRPVGWVLYAAMALSTTTYVLYWFFHPHQLVRYHSWALLGVLLVVLPFVLPCALWAETYVLAGDKESRRAKHAL
jgi:hypothetical protein